MEEFSDLVVFGFQIRELMLEKGIQKYKTDEDFDEFKDNLVASLSPATIKCLEIAVEELTDSRKDYHIVMSFVDELKKISLQKLEEVDKLFNPIEIVEED